MHSHGHVCKTGDWAARRRAKKNKLFWRTWKIFSFCLCLHFFLHFFHTSCSDLSRKDNNGDNTSADPAASSQPWKNAYKDAVPSPVESNVSFFTLLNEGVSALLHCFHPCCDSHVPLLLAGHICLQSKATWLKNETVVISTSLHLNDKK